MATAFLAIFDETGLPNAAPYYQQFPREPSPRGDMRLSTKVMKRVSNMTLGTLLDQMALIGAGGVAMVVCHGVTTGLLIRVASNGTFAESDALKVIMSAAEVDDLAAKIKAMPARNETELKAKLAAWKKLMTERKIANVAGELTQVEAEKVYRQWFENEAKRVRIKSATLRELIKKMKAVRAKALERVEIRACSAGQNKDTMETLKRFFGCGRLLAPTGTTFFLHPFFIDSVRSWPSIVHWDPVRREREAGNRVRLAGPLSRLHANLLRSSGEKREFLQWGAAFVMKIWELEPFKFAAMGAAGRPLRTVGPRNLEPDWQDVRQFVHQFIMPASTYRQGSFRAAGFWEPSYTPRKGQPKLQWVLPNEPEYLAAIAQT